MAYIATVYRDYLQDKLGAHIAVSKDVPPVRSRQQVAVLSAPASGHAKPEVFQWQRFIVQCWALDEDTTADLCNAVRHFALLSKREIPTVHKVVIVGEPGRFDDPDDTAPRFQMVFDALFKIAVPQSFPAAM